MFIDALLSVQQAGGKESKKKIWPGLMDKVINSSSVCAGKLTPAKAPSSSFTHDDQR